MANVSPAKLTYTGSTGAGQANTALVLTGVTDLEVDFVKNTLRVINNGIQTYFDYSVITSVTWSIASGLATITMS